MLFLNEMEKDKNDSTFILCNGNNKKTNEILLMVLHKTKKGERTKQKRENQRCD